MKLQAVLLLIAAVLAYVFVVQPLAERSLGVALPTIPVEGPAEVVEAPAEPSPDTQRESGSQRETESSSPQADARDFQPSDLSGLLREEGRNAYRSPAGLLYTRGSQHGHRLSHVMAHARDEPNRVGQHGVFDDEDPATVIRLIDTAYEQALSGRGVRTQREGERTIYTVDLGRRVGYIGGQSGNRRDRPPAEHVRLVTQGDRLITAYPIRP